MAVQAQVRQATAERWQAALERAIANAVDILIEPISGEVFCESASKPGILYVVTRETCSCAAGAAGDPVCQHRAAFLAQLGELVLDPEPVGCVMCSASGVRWFADGTMRCETCNGTGFLTPAPAPVQIPVRIRERIGVAA